MQHLPGEHSSVGKTSSEQIKAIKRESEASCKGSPAPRGVGCWCWDGAGGGQQRET